MGKTRDTGFLGNCVFTDSSNNVGIGGAASGSYKLQVTGTTNLTGALSGTSATFSANSTSVNINSSTRAIDITGKNSFYALSILGGSGTGTSFGQTISAGTNSSDVAFQIYNQAESAIRLMVRGDGYVGIGTSGPTNLLHVAKDLPSEAIVNINNTSSTGFGVSIAAGGGTRYALSLNDYSGAAISRFLANGNVLVGTTTDNGDKFQVTGGSTFTGNMGVGGGSTSGQRLRVVGASTTSSDFGLVVANSSGPSTFLVRNDGLIIIPSLVSTFTTAASANMWVNPSDGAVSRSTSSIKYKKNVENYNKGLDIVMQLRPVSYEGKSKIDEGKIFAGLIAEEVHDLGLTEFVQYAEDGTPDALAYQNMIALAFKAIQELKLEIDELKNK